MRYFKFTVFLVFFSLSFSFVGQSVIEPIVISNQHTVSPLYKQKVTNAKVAGAVLWREDFNGSLPNGWVVVNTNPNNIEWEWSSNYRAGQFTRWIPAIGSSTGGNGFMSLPMDSFNTPIPVTGSVAADTWFGSPEITLQARPSVTLRFQQSLAYCCNANVSLTVEVSKDSLNWDVYDAKRSLPVNALTVDPEHVSLDVSSTLANSSKAYIRFKAVGMTQYFWMVDDVELVETPTNAYAIELSDVIFSHGFNTNTAYTQIPLQLLDSIDSRIVVRNVGVLAQTNLENQIELFLDSNINGGSFPLGIVHAIGSVPVNMGPGQVNTIQTPVFRPSNFGHYRLKNTLQADSNNQIPARGTREFSFAVTDSILAKDDGDFPFNGYRPFFGNGYRMASIFNMTTKPSVLNSVSVYVANDLAAVGAVMQVKIWGYDDNVAVVNDRVTKAALDSSSVLRTITQADLGNWVVVPLANPLALQASSQYAVGVEQVGGTGSLNIGTKYLRNENRPYLQTLIRGATTSWDAQNMLIGIRLNLAQLSVGISDQRGKEVFVKVFPNPTIDNLTIQHTEQIKAIRVQNILGKEVYADLAVHSTQTAINLDGIPNGIYLISIITKDNRETVRKIIKG